MPEYSGPGHKIVAIDMSFPCRQFDRLMASDPSGTTDARHARLQPQIRTVTR